MLLEFEKHINFDFFNIYHDKLIYQTAMNLIKLRVWYNSKLLFEI